MTRGQTITHDGTDSRSKGYNRYSFERFIGLDRSSSWVITNVPSFNWDGTKSFLFLEYWIGFINSKVPP